MGYRVTGEFVQVTSKGPTGEQRIALYKGAMLPDDVPQDEIRHHLSVNMVEQVGANEGPLGQDVRQARVQRVTDLGGEGGSVTDDVGGPAEGTPPAALGDTVAFDDPERARAREKLPQDGSAPDGRASEAVWVEYAVSKGYDYSAVKDAGRDEVKKLFNK